MKIAMIAHDHCKADLIAWVKRNESHLKTHVLCGTGTTAQRISEATHLTVEPFLSGPQGGDQQVGAKIAEGEINALIFFWDPLASQPHDPDVKALLRIAVLKNIPIAMNSATADALIQTKKNA
jgi:methylglyoxal synthase